VRYVFNHGIGARALRVGMLAMLAALAVGAAQAAAVPPYFAFQGRLPDAGAGPVDLTIRLYNDPTSTAPAARMFSETHSGVPLTDGVFSVLIGEPSGGLSPADLTTSTGEIWLALSVDGGAELTPRIQLVTTPFAFKAQMAEKLVAPDSLDAVVTVDSARIVQVDHKVELRAATDNGGYVRLFNDSDFPTIVLDGDSADGGKIDMYNGVDGANVATVRLDGADAGDGRIDLYDAENNQSVRIHSDRINDAPEFAMFFGQTGGLVETVEMIANSEGGDFATGGRMQLRRLNEGETNATTTVELKAVSDGLLGGTGSGGYLELSYSNGDPVFTVQAGSAGALFPAFMELRAAGQDSRFYATPTSLSLYDSSNNRTVYLSSTTSELAGDLTVGGEVTTSVLTITGGSDLSEQFDVRSHAATERRSDEGGNAQLAAPTSELIQPGMVVSIDADQPGALVVSSKPYDRTVAGVISGAGGVNTGMVMSQSGTIADGKHPVALTGRVWVQCDATTSAIEPGDLLTTSATPGHAMVAADYVAAQGAVIGKAMTRLARGERGLVLTLVNLQ